MYGIRPLENSLCQLFFRLLCVFILYISYKLHVLCTAGREKSRELEVKKAMAEGSVNASGAGPSTASTSARRIASVPTREAATIVFQFECPGRITHRTQTSSSLEKCWETLPGNTGG